MSTVDCGGLLSVGKILLVENRNGLEMEFNEVSTFGIHIVPVNWRYKQTKSYVYPVIYVVHENKLKNGYKYKQL